MFLLTSLCLVSRNVMDKSYINNTTICYSIKHYITRLVKGRAVILKEKGNLWDKREIRKMRAAKMDSSKEYFKIVS